MKRLPYLSNDKLGSQHASPRLSLSPISFLVQVAPPSKLTPSNNPAAGWSTFVTITMLFGLVGLTATVSSDSLVSRWLTSMFAGIEPSSNCLLAAAALAWPGCRSKLMLSDTAPTRAIRLSRAASAETRGSKNHAYGRREGSQGQEQEGSDRVKGGLRC